MLARLRVLVVVGLALVTVPALGQTQQAVSNATRVAPSTGGPRLDRTATAAHRVTQSTEAAAVMQRRRQSAGKPAALMIVGGAAVVLGALIGDDVGVVFMVAGAVAFLYGLFLYLE